MYVFFRKKEKINTCICIYKKSVSFVPVIKAVVLSIIKNIFLDQKYLLFAKGLLCLGAVICINWIKWKILLVAFPTLKNKRNPNVQELKKKNNEEQKQKIQQTNSIYNDI